MDRHSTPTLRIEPKASRQLLLFLLSTHFSALLIISFLPIELVLQSSIAILVVINLIYSVRLHIFRSCASAICRAEWDGEGDWNLLLASGELLEVELRPSSYVQPWLVILNFSTGQFSTQSLILTSDAVKQDLLRRLRVRLRTGLLRGPDSIDLRK